MTSPNYEPGLRAPTGMRYRNGDAIPRSTGCTRHSGSIVPLRYYLAALNSYPLSRQVPELGYVRPYPLSFPDSRGPRPSLLPNRYFLIPPMRFLPVPVCDLPQSLRLRGQRSASATANPVYCSASCRSCLPPASNDLDVTPRLLKSPIWSPLSTAGLTTSSITSLTALCGQAPSASGGAFASIWPIRSSPMTTLRPAAWALRARCTHLRSASLSTPIQLRPGYSPTTPIATLSQSRTSLVLFRTLRGLFPSARNTYETTLAKNWGSSASARCKTRGGLSCRPTRGKSSTLAQLVLRLRLVPTLQADQVTPTHEEPTTHPHACLSTNPRAASRTSAISSAEQAGFPPDETIATRSPEWAPVFHKPPHRHINAVAADPVRVHTLPILSLRLTIELLNESPRIPIGRKTRR